MNNFFSRRGVNIDISNACALECPNCPRQFQFRDRGLRVPGKNLTLDDFKKVSSFFDSIDFEGQLSDPVHNPDFIEMLEICYENNNRVEIHNASSGKKKDWYYRAFEANPNANWVFSIDGLPSSSFIYRVNQDGEKLFDVMKSARLYLDVKPTWQYIVFSYNENEIDEAIELANKIDVNFYLLLSSRWLSINDPLMPSKEYRAAK